MSYFVYIIRSFVDNTLYKGSSSNVEKRLAAHNAGESRYTSKKVPWELVYMEELDTKTSALIRERKLKRSNTKSLKSLIDKYQLELEMKYSSVG